MIAFAVLFKEQLKYARVESQGLRVELEEAKIDLQVKEDELSKLFDDADHQFAVGANSALQEIKSKYPDFDYSFLGQSPFQDLALPASSFEEHALDLPAPEGSAVSLLESAHSVPGPSSSFVAPWLQPSALLYCLFVYSL